VLVWKSKDSFAPDYRGWFYIGLILAPIGIVMALTLDNTRLLVVCGDGAGFHGAGNGKTGPNGSSRRNFADLTPGQKRLKLVLIRVVLLFSAGRIVSFCVFREPASGGLNAGSQMNEIDFV